MHATALDISMSAIVANRTVGLDLSMSAIVANRTVPLIRVVMLASLARSGSDRLGRWDDFLHFLLARKKS